MLVLVNTSIAYLPRLMAVALAVQQNERQTYVGVDRNGDRRPRLKLLVTSISFGP